MSASNVIRGPWAPLIRCDGCGQNFAGGHVIDPIFFRLDPRPYRLCFGCFESDRFTLLHAAQRARKPRRRGAS